MRNFDDAPFLVIWELTQACDLACVHCRACAIESRNPFELTTEEGCGLLEEIRSFGDPLMVFTGGDPLKRPDLFPLLERSVRLGLRTTVTPSATPLLTESAIEGFKDCGVARMAISVDGPDSESHDGFRRVEGSFDRSILALAHARKVGLQTQVNTTVTRHNVGLLGEIAQLVELAGAKLWSVFFLVATGRASASQDLTAEEYEEVFGFLYDLSKTVHSTSRPPKPSTIADTSRNAVRQKASALAQHGRQPPRSFRDRPGSMTARDSYSSRTLGKSTPVVSCRWPQGTCVAIRLPPCTGSRRYSVRSATRITCKESAANVNTAICAGVPDRAPMR